MESFFEKLASVNGVINDFVWVKIGLFPLVGSGILLTCCTKFFQVSHLGHWWKMTIGSLFVRDSDATKKTDKKTISQFQALCTALAATIGTGNYIARKLKGEDIEPVLSYDPAIAEEMKSKAD